VCTLIPYLLLRIHVCFLCDGLGLLLGCMSSRLLLGSLLTLLLQLQL
jgi:hypothetical protein